MPDGKENFTGQIPESRSKKIGDITYYYDRYDNLMYCETEDERNTEDPY